MGWEVDRIETPKPANQGRNSQRIKAVLPSALPTYVEPVHENKRIRNRAGESEKFNG
jgi:hypothetical protein